VQPAETCRNEKCAADIRNVRSSFHGFRFHDLRHTCITKLAEGQASEQTLMSIAGHLSMAAKRAALDAIAKPVLEALVVQNPLHFPTAQKPTAPN